MMLMILKIYTAGGSFMRKSSRGRTAGQSGGQSGRLIRFGASPREAEHEKITIKGYVCAANNYRQKKAACSEPRYCLER
jgi:hypothetical protein